MHQFLEFDHPIPSCSIHALKFKDKQWKYVYALTVPFLLTEENEEPLVVYEYICDLILKKKSDLHQESINLEVHNLKDILSLLKSQRDYDLLYREKWKLEHPDHDDRLNVVVLPNKDLSYGELKRYDVHYISFVVQQNDFETIFAAV